MNTATDPAPNAPLTVTDCARTCGEDWAAQTRSSKPSSVGLSSGPCTACEPACSAAASSATSGGRWFASWAPTDSPVSPDAVAAPLHEQGAVNHPALTPIHWWDGCDIRPHKSERLDALAPLAAAFYTGEAPAVIKAASGKTSHSDISGAWGLAMGAVYGPIGAHESQGGHPEVVKFKARCLAALRTYLSV